MTSTDRKYIAYFAGYKFQLEADYSQNVGFAIPAGIAIPPWVALDADGTLHVKAGYAWDGASGPIEQSAHVLRGSLVHDALYQLMREGKLDQSYRESADMALKQCCIDDGMSHWYAQAIFSAVREFGAASAALGAVPYPVLYAPSKP